MSGSVWTIVVAAGSGQRFGGAKQFADLGGRSVLDWSLAAARSVSDGVVVVLPSDDARFSVTAVSISETGMTENGGAGGSDVVVVPGGATRSASVRSGLAQVPADAEVVCVHDAARPFASPALFAAVVAAVRAGADGVVPGIAVTDTIKVVVADAGVGAAGGERVVVATPDRATLVAVQTPQAFKADALRTAHQGGGTGTDDAALVEAAGGRVVVVRGEPANRKLTDPQDLDWARSHAASLAATR